MSTALEVQIRQQLEALGANIIVEEISSELPVSETTHQVSGYIFFDDGTPATDLAIRLIDKKFGNAGTILAGTETVKADGSYTFSYTPPNTLPINVEVVAVESNSGPEVSLCKTIFNAGTDITLNLVAPTKVTIKTDSGKDLELTLRQAPAPEFQSLTADLSRQMPLIENIAEAKETEDQHDLSVLHQTTGWDARLIGLTAKAYQNTQTTGLEPEALYALYRTGLPFNNDKLALVDSKVVNDALTTARDSGIIILDDTQIRTETDKFNTFSRNARLSLKAPDAVSTIGELIDKSTLSPEEKIKFADIYFSPQAESIDLWKKVKEADIDDTKISALQLQGKLAYLTLNNAELTNNLQAEIKTIDKLSSLVEQGLHTPETWVKRIEAIANNGNTTIDQLIPPTYIGETIQERLELYSEELAHKVRLSFPTQLVQHMLDQGELTVYPTDSISDDEAEQIRKAQQLTQSVSTFLKNAAPLGYQLGRTSLDTFVEAHQSQLQSGITVDFEKVLDGVRQQHNLYQITPTDNALKQINQAKILSAHNVTDYTYAQFIDRFKGTDLTLIEADLVYRKAQQVTAVTQNLITYAQQLSANPLIPTLSSSAEKRDEAKKTLLKTFPGLDTLLGSLDYCECKHCRSVLSPAAYLVDLLQFLDPKPDIWAYFTEKWKKRHNKDYSHPVPFDVLQQRRPDIPHIDLTCENTHTVLPYIDLVNEIFEHYIANDNKLSADAARNIENEATANLLAEPQHVLNAAYTKLSQAKYPLTLPFDLWIETVRQFFGHSDMTLAETLEICSNQPALFGTSGNAQPYNRAAIHAEQLGLSPSEYTIFTEPQTINELYGYKQDESFDLSSAKVLAHRLNISYKELVKLIKVQWISPSQPLELFAPDVGCSFEQTTIRYRDNSPASDSVFLRFNLFVRLWKKLGWTADVLDAALSAFTQPLAEAQSPLNIQLRTVLVYLAHLQTLASKLRLGRDGYEELLTLWSDIPIHGEHSLYAQLFLRPSILKENQVFLPKSGAYLSDSNRKLVDYRLPLQGALGLTAVEIEQILADAGIDKEAVLTLANVSLLYRYGLLSKALGLSVEDLISLKALSGLNPFHSPDSRLLTDDGATDHIQTQTLAFVAIAAQVKDTGFSIKDLNYLFRHQFDATSSYQKDSKEILTFVKTIVSEIKRIQTEHTIPTDFSIFTDDLIQQNLAILLPPDTVSDFMQIWTGKETAPQPKAFFDKYLKKAIVDNKHISGFFEENDANVLFPPKTSEPKTSAQLQTDLLERRQLIASRLIPYIQTYLSKKAISELFASELDADIDIVESLLTDTELFSIRKESAMTALMNSGIAAEINLGSKAFNQQTNSQPLVFEGYMEVPTTGAYRFYAKVDQADATVSLEFGHQAQPLLSLSGGEQEKEVDQLINLQVGKLYPFTLSVNTPSGGAFQLEVQGKNIPRGSIDRLTLYPKAVQNQIERIYLTFSKALQLISGFSFTESEIRYFSRSVAGLGKLSLSQLPTAEGTDDDRELFKGFLRLAHYQQLKLALNESDDALIEIFEKGSLSERRTDIAKITRRTTFAVESVASWLQLSTDKSLAYEQDCWRLWQLLHVVTKLGVSVESLTSWLDIVNIDTSGDRRQSIAEDLRNTIKARYSLKDWQRIAQSTFDPLRQKKRDALVAYILSTHPELERPEQLFEYFLIDPGMEPVVQTSRIRTAISSVQLFIQRCFLNLEPQVDASALDSKHWQWMKRYRVWEANRKIFLYPENWLEPEFRDNKSALFQTLESELLQGDISNESAENVFFNYLKGLEEISRLELVSMYLEEHPISAESNIIHVIGRTQSSHKYFYRRLESLVWTPWEPIPIKIEGDHIAAIVWKERLNIFWVTFTERSMSGNSNNIDDQTMDKVKLGDLKENSKLTVRPILNWCERFQGEWKAPESSNFISNAEVGVDDSFDKRKVFISIEKAYGENGEEAGIFVRLEGSGFLPSIPRGTFDYVISLASKNSVPEFTTKPGVPKPHYTGLVSQKSYHQSSSRKQKLQVTYRKPVNKAGALQWEPVSEHLIEKKNNFSLLTNSDLSYRADVKQSLLMPFFYLDKHHNFFVKPTMTEVTIDQFSEYYKSPKGNIGGKIVGHELPNKPSVLPEVKNKLKESVKIPEIQKDLYRIFDFKRISDPLTNPGVAVDFGGNIKTIFPSGGRQNYVLSPDVKLPSESSYFLKEGVVTVDGNGFSMDASDRVDIGNAVTDFQR